MRLMTARDVYSKHYDELSPKQKLYVEDFLALSMLEKEANNPDAHKPESPKTLDDMPANLVKRSPPKTPT
ncbi:MAG: hypothetical protein EOP06_00520 [Proteobacteria bacterium]|nr:MAG: hypothetical protein EOP06_00520 [Pseudomonadota bacterium]